MDKNFGSLAGFGGFPTRNAMPNSKPVANMDAWHDDWNARREQAIWEARAAATPDEPAIIDRNEPATTYRRPDGTTGVSSNGTLPYQAGRANDFVGVSYGPTPTTANLDLSDLYKRFDDERTNAFAPTIRNQQAYDSMRGWGQENGVMGANYIEPGHGQINGQAPASPLDQLLGQSGIDPAWATGTYDPYSPNSGTFGGARGGYDWAF